MSTQITREEGWPRSREVAALARRLTVIDWFELPSDAAGRSERVAGALEDHARMILDRGPPREARVLGSEDGRRLLGAGCNAEQALWREALARPLEKARSCLMESGRGRGHPLVDISGEAVLLRSDALPVDRERILDRLRGFGPGRIDEAIAGILLRRTLWEIGALLMWELVGDLAGENPYVSLLSLYEEGYYPLDLAADVPVLWAPLAQ